MAQNPISAASEGAGGTPTRTRHPLVGLVGLTVGLGVVLVLLLMVFIMPSLKSAPNQLPVGLVGATSAVEAWGAALEQAAPDGCATRVFASEAELVAAIEARDIVGGIAIVEDEVRVAVASAGSAVISGTISATAQAIAGATGATAVVTDVVPLPEGDPSGIGIGGLAFPLAGLKEAVGAAGFTIGAASMMFLGNPFAGISTSAVWLPAGLGLFGQLLPPGAAGTLVRAAAYFDWAGGAGAALTLGLWVVAGIVLLVIGAKRSRAKAAAEAAQAEVVAGEAMPATTV